jgi:hypothetical protein
MELSLSLRIGRKWWVQLRFPLRVFPQNPPGDVGSSPDQRKVVENVDSAIKDLLKNCGGPPSRLVVLSLQASRNASRPLTSGVRWLPLSKMKLFTAFMLCLILHNGFVVMSQNRLADQVQVKGPFQYQDNGAFLGGIAQMTPADTLIIVIARAGVNETRSNINKRRLYNVRTYLRRFTEKSASEAIILAEGERVKDYGRLEFYVNGKQWPC